MVQRACKIDQLTWCKNATTHVVNGSVERGSIMPGGPTVTSTLYKASLLDQL
jgi:hypothetical protein